MTTAPTPELEAMIERIVTTKVEERLGSVEARIEEALSSLKRGQSGQLERATLLVFSGDFDKLMSAFVIATGAVSMGLEVSMYFTFWGLTALKKQTNFAGKSIPDKMIAAMLPGLPQATPTSRINMGGIGPKFFQHQMAAKNVESLPNMIDLASELGVKMIACQMAMDVMGITEAELRDDIEYGGVATYMGEAIDSKVTLFI